MFESTLFSSGYRKMHSQYLPCMCLGAHMLQTTIWSGKTTSTNRTTRKLKSLSICGIHSKLPAAQADFKCKQSKSGKFVKGKTPPKPRYEK